MTAHETLATLIACEPLTDRILKVILQPEHYLAYHAGQYLQLILAEETVLSYSIANAPLGTEHYELHIRHQQANPLHQHLLTRLKIGQKLHVRLPFGTCDWQHLDSVHPLLLIAQGTGFAPIKAILEYMWAEKIDLPVTLFWSGRFKKDLYLDEMVRTWEQIYPHFQYEAYPLDSHQTHLMMAVLKRYAGRLHEQQIVMSGAFERVYQMRDQLVSEGAIFSNIYSDAFLMEQK